MLVSKHFNSDSKQKMPEILTLSGHDIKALKIITVGSHLVQY